MSKFYHHPDKGCVITKEIKFVNNGRNQLIEGYCNTCQKEICRCGWEWGMHNEKPNAWGVKALFKDKACRTCFQTFTPTSGNQTKCEKCNEI